MRIITSALALATVALACPAESQDWPQRQVTVVVPFSAGGTTDMFARILAQGLAQKYGTPFVVDNRPGAGGNVGAAAVARAAKDGNTLLVGTVSTHAINPFIYKNLQQQLLAESPWVWMFRSDDYYLVGSSVQGFTPRPDEQLTSLATTS